MIGYQLDGLKEEKWNLNNINCHGGMVNTPNRKGVDKPQYDWNTSKVYVQVQFLLTILNGVVAEWLRGNRLRLWNLWVRLPPTSLKIVDDA